MSEKLAMISCREDLDMVTFRGDLADPGCARAIEAVTGCAMPDTRKIVSAGDHFAAWMSPDELLILGPGGRGDSVVAALSEHLAGQHHMAVNVSDARAVFRIDGPGCREVLARGAPVGLSRDAFTQGDFRRTRLGQVAVAFWMSGDASFALVCFRSVAGYVADWLANAADSPEAGVL